ncbi:hypothetical protein K525DRAFT_246349, partial [Schizophyllum commune Loenen D]
ILVRYFLKQSTCTGGRGVTYRIGCEPEAAQRPGRGLWLCRQHIRLFCNRPADNCRGLLQKTYLHRPEGQAQQVWIPERTDGQCKHCTQILGQECGILQGIEHGSQAGPDGLVLLMGNVVLVLKTITIRKSIRWPKVVYAAGIVSSCADHGAG